MNRTQQLAALQPHLKRPIRAFLADKAVANRDPERAFWAALYNNVRCTCHSEAKRIAEALEISTERVERVLEGWRP